MTPRGKRSKRGKKGTTAQSSPWRKAAGDAVGKMGQAAIERLKERLGLNTEVKQFFDNYPSTALTASFAAKLDVPAIAEGTTDLTRNGSSIRVTRTSIRGVVRPNATDTSARLVRVVAVYNPWPNGTPTAIAQLFNNTGAIDSVYSADLDATDIVVIYDQTFNVGPAIQALSNHAIHIEDSRLEHHMVWKSSDTAGTSSNLLQGGISVFAIEDAGANFATIELHRVTEFVDN